MRKLFATTFGLSALLALLIGAAVYAWTGSASSNFSTTTGKISVALHNVIPTGNKVYPTNSFIAVLTGEIQNDTQANPGIAVHITGGSVSNITSNAGPGSPCNVFINASGVIGQVVVTNGGSVGPGGAAGGGWRADLAMGPSAPNDCQDRTLSYTVTVNVAT